MSKRVSRRECMLIAASAPLCAQVTQKVPPEGAPAPLQPGATPEQRVRKAYADVHDIGVRLSTFELSTDIEPAFAFRANF